ncbi:Bgt-51830 [Blumeria graminis f. sp. tritici]|uniref:Bgt-51830 n=1 Tax=Blumeria graminis f. sp. tritici TaxID=62690 RepID=A0A9X9QH10_BLUGR|nr:Bgt-51830 [Blumeria graminis f. sp. tritici]
MPLNRISRQWHLVWQGSTIGPYSYNTLRIPFYVRQGGTVPRKHTD